MIFGVPGSRKSIKNRSKIGSKVDEKNDPQKHRAVADPWPTVAQYSLAESGMASHCPVWPTIARHAWPRPRCVFPFWSRRLQIIHIA